MSPMIRALVLATSLTAAAAAMGGLGYWEITRPGPLAAGRDIDIARGGGGRIADQLVRERVIRSALLFRAAAFLTSQRGVLHAAEFAFPARASTLDVLTILRTGRPVQHAITFPEGVTAARVAEILAADSSLSGAVPVPREGWVLPQTYAHLRGVTAESVLARAHAALLAALTPPPGMGAREMLILASLVERESARAEERPLIAGVFLNRLRLGMKLQTDPATIYGASGGTMELGRGLLRSELLRDDPYNTYVLSGLPAGPICAPGLATIAAVRTPAATDALYFVADGQGGHSFARTLPEHERNVARYRALGGG